jgi:hypothetical protein
MTEEARTPPQSLDAELRLVIINEQTVAAARSRAKAFLETRPELTESIQTVVFASRAMGDLYPETLETLFSGHVFPVSQAEQELETSIELAMEGFYTYAFVALRTVLELELLGVYFSVDDSAHTEIQSWLLSQERTPPMSQMLPRIFTLPALQQADKALGLRKRVSGIYDELGGYRVAARAVRG